MSFLSLEGDIIQIYSHEDALHVHDRIPLMLISVAAKEIATRIKYKVVLIYGCIVHRDGAF